MDRNIKKYNPLYNSLIGFLLALSSCEKALDVELDRSKVTTDVVFSNDITATAAMAGVYYDMLDTRAWSSGADLSVLTFSGLSADELSNYGRTDIPAVEINDNSIFANNPYVLQLWASLYKTIYSVNAVIEGLNASSGVSVKTKEQLRGEALFIRAYANFELVNFFGDVPLVTTTDYRKNSLISRSPVTEIYAAIIEDLNESKELLQDEYIMTERIRPNRSTVIALLARVYLYQRDWQKAESAASEVIAIPDYLLEPDLAKVFVAESKEAIWQLKQPFDGYNTWEAQYFNPDYASYYSILNRDFVPQFEAGDQRLTQWIGIVQDSLYTPFKYKVYNYGDPLTEYSIVFRLAEQYLIRAEARAHRQNVSGSQEDLNMTRNRAGLPNTSANDEASLLLAIENERKFELFAEAGHRWLDLKRTGRADAVLGPLKAPNWQTADQLYPIPQSEIIKNRNLTQNPGY